MFSVPITLVLLITFISFSSSADLCDDENFSLVLSHLVPQIDDGPQDGKGTVLIVGEKEFSIQSLVSEHKYTTVDFKKFRGSEHSVSSLPESLPQSSVVICVGAAHFLGQDPSEGHVLSAELVSLLTASRPRVVIFASSGPLEHLTLTSAHQSAKQNLSAVGSPQFMGYLEEMIGSTESPVWRNERTNSFWVDLFGEYGYQYSVISTGHARNMAFSLLNQQEKEEECHRNECFLFSRLAFFARNGLVFYPKSNHARLTKEQNALARDPSSMSGLGWFNLHCVISIDWLTSESNLFRTFTALLERDRLEYLTLFSQLKFQWFTRYLNQLLRTNNYTTSVDDRSQTSLSSHSIPLAGTYCSVASQKANCQDGGQKTAEAEKWKQVVVSVDEQNLLSQDQALQTLQPYTEGKHEDLLLVALTQLVLIQKYQLYTHQDWLQREAKWVVLPMLSYLSRSDVHLPSTQLTLELVARTAVIQELERVMPEVNLDSYINLVLSNSESHQDKVSEGFKLQILIAPGSSPERKEALRKNLNDYRILDVWGKSSL